MQMQGERMAALYNTACCHARMGQGREGLLALQGEAHARVMIDGLWVMGRGCGPRERGTAKKAGGEERLRPSAARLWRAPAPRTPPPTPSKTNSTDAKKNTDPLPSPTKQQQHGDDDGDDGDGGSLPRGRLRRL